MNKNRIFWLVVTAIALGIMLFFVSLYETKSEHQKKLTESFEKFSPDSIPFAYMTIQEETPEIKSKVIKYTQLEINETENFDVIHIKALIKAAGQDSVAKFMVTLDSTTVLSPKLVNLVMDSFPEFARDTLYNRVLESKNLKGALWLFRIKPDSLLTRLHKGYYPKKNEIIENLNHYYPQRMSDSIVGKILKITADSVIRGNMGIFDGYIMKNEPQRILQLYSTMNYEDFCSYYEAEEKIISLMIGTPVFLKAQLKKAKTSELLMLYKAGVINRDIFVQEILLRPINDFVEGYNPDVYDSDLLFKVAIRANTEEDVSQLVNFFKARGFQDHIDFILEVKGDKGEKTQLN